MKIEIENFPMNGLLKKYIPIVLRNLIPRLTQQQPQEHLHLSNDHNQESTQVSKNKRYVPKVMRRILNRK
jgi:hypothetical protein